MSSPRSIADEEEMAAVQEALAWGTSPRLYLSYGVTDDVEAMPSFTLLSPPMGLDLFAVLDGCGLGAAATSGECKHLHLLALLRDAIAKQVHGDLFRDSLPFLDGMSTVKWWETRLREAFQVFHEKAAACSQSVHGEDAPAATSPTAIVVLLLERYLVIGNCGASKAVLSRNGELVELSSNSQDIAIRGDEIKTVESWTSTDVSMSSVPAPAPVVGGTVDVVTVKRDARDEFLILASAALWDKLTPAAACAHIRLRLGSTSTKLLAEELARMALHAGSRDNVSVGVVVFREFGDEASSSTIIPTPV